MLNAKNGIKGVRAVQSFLFKECRVLAYSTFESRRIEKYSSAEQTTTKERYLTEQRLNLRMLRNGIQNKKTVINNRKYYS